MTIQDIPLLRLANQGIVEAPRTTPLAIIQRMGALQAQDYHGAMWALGLRTGCTGQEIIAAIESRTVIRTWPQRGTLHFVSAADANWMVALSAERLLNGARHRREQLGLDDQILTKSKEVLKQLLGGGHLLTRPQIMQALEQAGIVTTGGRGYHILWFLSQNGVTYIGPMHAKQQTIGLLHDLVPHPQQYDRPAALAEHAKRYVVSHGPATIQDFMWWSGLTARDAQVAMQANQAIFCSEVVDGITYWMDRELPRKLPSGDCLLPGFDEYILGYKDRSAVLHADHAPKIVPGGNGMFLPVITLSGQIVGTWKRTLKKDHVLLTLMPFDRLSKAALQRLDVPIAAFARFVGLPPKIEVLS